MNAETKPQYLTDAQGRLVPIGLVKPLDLARHELTTDIIHRAVALQYEMAKFKEWAMTEIAAFVELSAMEYNITIGGEKGNVTLTTYDGAYKVQRSMQEHVIFDERLQVAKKLIDECIEEWTAGASDNVRALVDHAFKTDAEGRVSTSRVLGLRRLNITDVKWRSAMEAITESLSVIGSKSYLRIYKRVGKSNEFQAITLDFAAL